MFSIPLQMMLVAVAGWVNREQLAIVDYLKEENRVLRELHGKRRLRFTDDQRRRLAVKGKTLGRRLLRNIGTLVIPDMILRWHRELIARKCDGSATRGPGRPRVMEEIRALVVRMAIENEGWGYTRILGELTKLAYGTNTRRNEPGPGSLLRVHALIALDQGLAGSFLSGFSWGCLSDLSGSRSALRRARFSLLSRLYSRCCWGFIQPNMAMNSCDSSIRSGRRRRRGSFTLRFRGMSAGVRRVSLGTGLIPPAEIPRSQARVFGCRRLDAVAPRGSVRRIG